MPDNAFEVKRSRTDGSEKVRITDSSHVEAASAFSPKAGDFVQRHLVFMPLHERLIEVTAKTLIACRGCHALGDVSISGSAVKLVCPRCHECLGNWETTAAASADLTAFIDKESKPTTGQ